MGEWTPDMPSTTGGESTGLNDARNVYPNNVGYSPFPTPVDISPEADQELTAVYAGKNNALVQIFAGSDEKLYKKWTTVDALHGKKINIKIIGFVLRF